MKKLGVYSTYSLKEKPELVKKTLSIFLSKLFVVYPLAFNYSCSGSETSSSSALSFNEGSNCIDILLLSIIFKLL